MATKDDALRLLREGQSHQFAEPPDYVAAEKAYRNAAKIAQSWGEPYHWLAFTLEQRGSLEEAEDMLTCERFSCSRTIRGLSLPSVACSIV